MSKKVSRVLKKDVKMVLSDLSDLLNKMNTSIKSGEINLLDASQFASKTTTLVFTLGGQYLIKEMKSSQPQRKYLRDHKGRFIKS